MRPPVKPRQPLIVELPTVLSRMVTSRAVAIEIRAAELAAIGESKDVNRFEAMSNVEFDWYVSGDWPAHAPERWPETDEELSGYLAHQIRWHDSEQWLAEQFTKKPDTEKKT